MRPVAGPPTRLLAKSSSRAWWLGSVTPCLRCTRILIEPLDRAAPGLLRCKSIIAFRCRVIKEAVDRVWINVAFESDVVLFQVSSLRGISARQRLIQPTVVDQDGRLDLWNVLRL